MTIEIYIALALIGFALTFYLMLDGYDVGLGIMLPFQGNIQDQRVLVSIVQSSWDGNESWIILIGTMLWGAFPGVYSTVLPDHYIYLYIMLFGFFLRAVSMEFQGTKRQFAQYWRYLFFLSSWMIVLPQGLIFANIICSFLNPAVVNHVIMNTCIVLLLVLMYGINGMNWQYMKSVGRVKKKAVLFSRWLIVSFLIIFSISLWMLLQKDAILISFSKERAIALIAVAVLIYMVLIFMYSYYSFKKVQQHVATFYAALMIDLLLVIGLGLFMFPYISPEVLIENTASPSPSSIRFLVIGVGLCMPMVLWYNLFAYRVFKGKQKYVNKH
ncbi:cytochrome d ubiquinol oxidase subunit II [Sphingobacterium lactis]|uniref:cytochrome d ubiquinol oxidase subunit II n=1 Tax=Sphingobacterium lactis TaxID=797291 RepID=UPI003F7DF07D